MAARPRVSVYIAHSVDGFIADREGSLDWLFRLAGTEDYGYAEFMAGVDGLAMGRATWDFIADEPDLPFEGRPVYVFTRRPARAREGVRFWERTAEEAVADWQAAGLQHVYVDGGRLISQFLDAGLVDDLTLTVVPILLGRGARLFHPVDAVMQLRLESATPYDSGLVQLRYARR